MLGSSFDYYIITISRDWIRRWGIWNAHNTRKVTGIVNNRVRIEVELCHWASRDSKCYCIFFNQTFLLA